MELKVILYIVAGVAYFIYKQFQKLQKEAIVRQAKIAEQHQSSDANNSKKVDAIQELSVNRKDLKSEGAKYLENKKVILNKREVKKSKQLENTASSLATFSPNQNIHEGEYNIEQSVVNTPQSSYSQIRNMILFNELLKRPTF